MHARIARNLLHKRALRATTDLCPYGMQLGYIRKRYKHLHILGRVFESRLCSAHYSTADQDVRLMYCNSFKQDGGTSVSPEPCLVPEMLGRQTLTLNVGRVHSCLHSYKVITFQLDRRTTSNFQNYNKYAQYSWHSTHLATSNQNCSPSYFLITPVYIILLNISYS